MPVGFSDSPSLQYTLHLAPGLPLHPPQAGTTPHIFSVTTGRACLQLRCPCLGHSFCPYLKIGLAFPLVIVGRICLQQGCPWCIIRLWMVASAQHGLHAAAGLRAVRELLFDHGVHAALAALVPHKQVLVPLQRLLRTRTRNPFRTL